MSISVRVASVALALLAAMCGSLDAVDADGVQCKLWREAAGKNPIPNGNYAIAKNTTIKNTSLPGGSVGLYVAYGYRAVFTPNITIKGRLYATGKAIIFRDEVQDSHDHLDNALGPHDKVVRVYSRPRYAALMACCTYWAKSKQQKREWGGFIWRINGTDLYGFTAGQGPEQMQESYWVTEYKADPVNGNIIPVRVEKKRWVTKLPELPEIPPKTGRIGIWHTHPIGEVWPSQADKRAFKDLNCTVNYIAAKGIVQQYNTSGNQTGGPWKIGSTYKQEAEDNSVLWIHNEKSKKWRAFGTPPQ